MTDRQELIDQALLLNDICRAMQDFPKAIQALVADGAKDVRARASTWMAVLKAIETAEALQPRMDLAIKTLQARIADLNTEGGTR